MLRHDEPKPIWIKAAKSHNFKRIYVNMMNLGNNIKLDILKSVFLFERGIFVSRDSLQQFSYLKRKVKMSRRDDM